MATKPMMKPPANIHDKTFHALMANRDFALGFYRAYLPDAIVKRIDFTSLSIFTLSGKVIGEKDLKHASIGPAEMVLKYIRSREFPRKYRAIIQKMTILDDKTRHILIHYLIQRADISDQLLLSAIIDHLPQDEEITMTAAEQIAQRNRQQGMQQGIYTVAKNMLRANEPLAKICRFTGLEEQMVLKIKQELHLSE